MKKIIIYSMLMFLAQVSTAQDAVFKLNPQQSMCMTGKGPGQDGAINPYSRSKCISIVKNLSSATFSVRIQQDGKIIREIPVKAKEEKEIVLEKGYELYLDTEEKAKAKITFKEFVEKE